MVSGSIVPPESDARLLAVIFLTSLAVGVAEIENPPVDRRFVWLQLRARAPGATRVAADT